MLEQNKTHLGWLILRIKCKSFLTCFIIFNLFAYKNSAVVSKVVYWFDKESDISFSTTVDYVYTSTLALRRWVCVTVAGPPMFQNTPITKQITSQRTNQRVCFQTSLVEVESIACQQTTDRFPELPLSSGLMMQLLSMHFRHNPSFRFGMGGQPDIFGSEGMVYLHLVEKLAQLSYNRTFWQHYHQTCWGKIVGGFPYIYML